jgi:hypothetical protein
MRLSLQAHAHAHVVFFKEKDHWRMSFDERLFPHLSSFDGQDTFFTPTLCDFSSVLVKDLLCVDAAPLQPDCSLTQHISPDL